MSIFGGVQCLPLKNDAWEMIRLPCGGQVTFRGRTVELQVGIYLLFRIFKKKKRQVSSGTLNFRGKI